MGLTLQLMTDREPAREQMAMYTKMLEVPCSGATYQMRYAIVPVAKAAYAMKAVGRKVQVTNQIITNNLS